MNINSVRTLLVVVNIGLAGGTGYTVYNEFVTKEVRRKQTDEFGDKLKSALDNAPKVTHKDQIRVSINVDKDLVDLTGDKPKAPETRVAETVASSRITNPLEDQIKIVTISVHPDPTQSKVTVMRKTATGETGNERLSFGEGDAIPFANDAVILEIHAGDVLFQNGDRQETLLIPDKPTPTPGGATGPGSRPADPGNRAFITYVESKKDSGTITIKSGGDKALAREGEAVLEGVVFSTTDGPNGKALKVDKVPSASVLAAHGVQDGDMLISIDGHPMSTRAEVVDYATSHRNQQVYAVVIQRRGQRIHKQVIIER